MNENDPAPLVDWSMCGPAGLCAFILTCLVAIPFLFIGDKLAPWLLFLPLAYFLPGIVAETRHHRNRLAIFILNLALGITLLGWLAALIWAVWNEKK